MNLFINTDIIVLFIFLTDIMKHYFKDTQKTTATSNPPTTYRLKRVNSLGILESPFRTNNKKIKLT